MQPVNHNQPHSPDRMNQVGPEFDPTHVWSHLQGAESTSKHAQKAPNSLRNMVANFDRHDPNARARAEVERQFADSIAQMARYIHELRTGVTEPNMILAAARDEEHANQWSAEGADHMGEYRFPQPGDQVTANWNVSQQPLVGREDEEVGLAA